MPMGAPGSTVVRAARPATARADPASEIGVQFGVAGHDIGQRHLIGGADQPGVGLILRLHQRGPE
jgi:hypothetical protein